MLHDSREVGDDLASLGIVASHASQPQAILLRPVEDGEGLLLDKFIALHRAQAKGVAVLFESEKELRPVRVFPRASVGRAAPQANDYGQMLNADWALILAAPAGGALERCF